MESQDCLGKLGITISLPKLVDAGARCSGFPLKNKLAPRSGAFLCGLRLLCQSVRTAADFDLMPGPTARATPQLQFDQRHVAMPRRDQRRQVEFLPPVAMRTHGVHRMNVGIVPGRWQRNQRLLAGDTWRGRTACGAPPGQLRLTCCLLLRGRLHWAKKASPRRGPSSPPVYWHLQQPFRPSHSRRWRSRHPLRHPLHRHRLHRHRLHPHPLHPHPRRLATMKLALPPGRALRQKPTSCSALHFSPCAANWRDDKASTPRGVGWWCHLLHFTLNSTNVPATQLAHTCQQGAAVSCGKSGQGPTEWQWQGAPKKVKVLPTA